MATVLVIDDDELMRELIQANLVGEGYEVRVASDGMAALAAMRPAPDLILLDLQMEGLDGRGFLLQLRALGLWGPPVIVVTGIELLPEQLDELGVAAVVRKPFDAKALVEVVRSATS